MNFRKLLITIVTFTLFLYSFVPFVGADELDDTIKEKQQKKEEKQQTKQQLFEAKQYEGTLASQLNQMVSDLTTARNEYALAEAQLMEKEKEITQNEEDIRIREAEVDYQTSLVQIRIRDLYKHSQYSPLTYLFLSQDFSEINAEYVYRLNVIRQDKKEIIDLKDRIRVLNEERQKLEAEKLELAEDKIKLEEQKVKLEAQEAYLNSQITAVQNLQNQLASELTGLQKEISHLTAKEKQILAAKAAAAAASTSVGSEEQNGGSIAKPSPKGQSGDYYSFWSYGFPHRVGMNQYGAYGRALSGQGAGEILHAYYTNTTIVGLDSGTGVYPVPDKIKVNGYGWIDFEGLYLKGIGEMPSSWPMEALKAQAIAARTYALSYIGYASYNSYTQYRNDAKAPSICTNQACQVFIGYVKDDRWAQAVDETKGMVIISGGVPITAYYASTAGGATLSSEEVWGGYRSYVLGVIDVDKSGKPYDGPSWGDSPWYHKAWGDDPWFSKEETIDLINASLLPADYDSDLPAVPNGFTPEEVRNKLSELKIAVVENLKSIEVIVGSQHTERFRIYYQDTFVDIEPERFRFVFNLRSKSTDAIWSSRFDIQTN